MLQNQWEFLRRKEDKHLSAKDLFLRCVTGGIRGNKFLGNAKVNKIRKRDVKGLTLIILLCYI